MNPLITIDLAKARHEDDLRRAEASRQSRLARRAAQDERRALRHERRALRKEQRGLRAAGKISARRAARLRT